MGMCVTCQENGVASVALRVINGRGYCDPCARNKLMGAATARQPASVPPIVPDSPTVPLVGPTKKTEERRDIQMSKEIDWAKAQERRNSGESVVDIAEELGVTGATVYNHTKAPAKDGYKVGPKPSSTKVVRRKKRGEVSTSFSPTAAAAVVVDNGKPMLLREKYEPLLVDLRAKRDKLDAIIKGLETI